MSQTLYRAVWRWHFFAGLLVVPFILILSVTGATYLFKPDLDRWQERAYRGLSVAGAVSPDQQVRAAMAAAPAGAIWQSYRLADQPGDAAMVHVRLNDGGQRYIYVSPQGTVLGEADPDTRFSAILSRFHGTLLMGRSGGLLVELTASWAILLILSGLYLWWPRGRRGLGGILYPRFVAGRLWWRDLHAVSGFWVSGLALLLLFTGLPWTDLWAKGFQAVRSEMGWTNTQPVDWRIGHGGDDGAHDHHGGAAMAMNHVMPAPITSGISINEIAASASLERMPAPAIIQPPGAPSAFGPPNGAMWKLTSETQNRPAIRSVFYDPTTGEMVARSGFTDKHVIDQIVGYGIAWHEGQLFGRINQAVGVMTALALITIAVSGVLMWWRRRPSGQLAAPPRTPEVQRGLVLLLTVAGIMLPMLGLSLIVIGLIELIALGVRRGTRKPAPAL